MRKNPTMSPRNLFPDASSSSDDEGLDRYTSDSLEEEVPLNEFQKRQLEKKKGKQPKRARGETKPSVRNNVSPADFTSSVASKKFDSFTGKETRLGHKYDLHLFPHMFLQGLLSIYMPLIVLKEQAYPLLVRLFFANMRVEDKSGEIVSSVRGKVIRLNSMSLEQIFKFGTTDNREIIWGSFWGPNVSVSLHDAKLRIMENSPSVPPVLLLSRLPALSRLLLHVIQYNLLTNLTRSDNVTQTETLVLYHLLNMTPIDPSFLMISCIKKVHELGDVKRIKFPYGNAFTKIFRFFGVDLSQENQFFPIKTYGPNQFKQYCHWQYHDKSGTYKSEDGRTCRYNDGVPVPFLEASPISHPPDQVATVPEPEDGASNRDSTARAQALIEEFTKRLEAVEGGLTQVLSTVSSLSDGLKDIRSHLTALNDTFSKSVKESEMSRESEYESFNDKLQSITFLLADQHKESQKGVHSMVSNLDNLEKTAGTSFSTLINILKEMIRIYKLDRVHLHIPPPHVNIHRVDASSDDDGDAAPPPPPE